jgi:uncharacterized protein YcbK (DUF882 family)
MGNLTENFSRHEFACKCGCGFDTIDWELLSALQRCVDERAGLSLKTSAKLRIVVNSGCRCPAHNKAEGGKPNSYHLKGRAADIEVFLGGPANKISPDTIADWFEKNYPHFGIGRYKTFTHVDSRGGKGWRG